MNEIYYYKEDTDELIALDEISNSELVELTADIEAEVDRRTWDMLQPFVGEITGGPMPQEILDLFKEEGFDE